MFPVQCLANESKIQCCNMLNLHTLYSDALFIFFPFPFQEQLLLEPMFHVPGSNATSVHICEAVVRGTQPPRYEYAEPKQQNLSVGSEGSGSEHSSGPAVQAEGSAL